LRPTSTPAAEGCVVDVGEQVAGLGQAAELLDRLLEGVLAPQALQLGDEHRRRHQAIGK
jgi:hypothetical protein